MRADAEGPVDRHRLVCRRASVRPPLDALLTGAPWDTAERSPSFVDNATGYYLTADQMRWFWSQYAGQTPREHPLLSPLYAADLRGHPSGVHARATRDGDRQRL